MLNMLNSIMRNTEEGTLKHDVCEIIVNELESRYDTSNNEEVIEYVRNIQQYGCASGIVNNMIYYRDTTAFFNDHADEIFTLLNECIEEGMTDANNITFSRNELAWWSFEIVTNEILYELEEAYEMM